MNNLSWLIYFAGVSGSLGNFLTFVMVVFGVLAAASIIVWLVMHDETDAYRRPLGEQALASCREMRSKSGRYAWGLIGLFLLVGTMAMMMPGRQTVLLIAASEMGEQVLNHPRVQTVVDPGIELLTTWMVKETADIKRQMSTQNK